MLIGQVVAGTMLLLAGTSALLHIYIHMGLLLGRPRENGTSQNLFATKLRGSTKSCVNLRLAAIGS